MWPYDLQNDNWLKARANRHELIAQAHSDRRSALAGLIKSGIYAVVSAFARWREKARLREELGGMTERELSDMGLTRNDLPAVIDGSYRDPRGLRSRDRAILVRITAKEETRLAA